MAKFHTEFGPPILVTIWRKKMRDASTRYELAVQANAVDLKFASQLLSISKAELAKRLATQRRIETKHFAIELYLG